MKALKWLDKSRNDTIKELSNKFVNNELDVCDIHATIGNEYGDIEAMKWFNFALKQVG